MNKISLQQTHGPLEESFLGALEQMLGFKLPDNYRDFLKCNNGGRPQGRLVFHFFEEADGSVLDNFYGIHPNHDLNLLKKIQYIGDRIPSDCFPIANDVFGNLILIVVKGRQRGKIYFWDHEMESEEGQEPTYENMTLVANSFEDFINGLQDEHVKDGE